MEGYEILELVIGLLVIVLITFLVLSLLPYNPEIYNPEIKSINSSVLNNITMAQSDLTIAEEISKENYRYKSYERGKYDCTQFSKRLIEKLSEVNITAYCVAGYMWDYNSDGERWRKKLHTWIEAEIDGKIVPIEATNGEVIKEDRYNNEYVIIRKDLCW